MLKTINLLVLLTLTVSLTSQTVEIQGELEISTINLDNSATEILVNSANGTIGYMELNNLANQCISGSILTVDNRDDALYSNYAYLGSTNINLTPDPLIADTWEDGAVATFGSAGSQAIYDIGNKILVWATSGGGSGIYDPISDSWSAISTSGEPSSRTFFQHVWTGTELLIWGGTTSTNTLSDGAIYNPSTDTWTSMSNSGAPSPRQKATATWTGSEMIIWGGNSDATGGGGSGYLGDGAKYNPSTDTWTTVSSTGAPSARFAHSANLVGDEVIFFGGYDGTCTNDGAKYDINSDNWTSISSPAFPVRGCDGTVDVKPIWTGEEIIYYGGDINQFFGGKYNPTSDTWIQLTQTANNPGTRLLHTTVWTGTEMIIFGGVQGSFGNPVATGASYNPVTNTWNTIANSGGGRWAHAAIWANSKMYVFGGSCPLCSSQLEIYNVDSILNLVLHYYRCN